MQASEEQAAQGKESKHKGREGREKKVNLGIVSGLWGKQDGQKQA